MATDHDAKVAGALSFTDLLPPSVVARFEIIKLLGRGGMGEVYLARERALNRLVAIKLLRPEGLDSDDARERFRREAQVAARLTHPNIVPLHTFGEEGGSAYFVMGYVPGETLAARIRRDGKVAPEPVRRVVRELADALDYAHRHGVVHRDVKPDNVLLDAESGRPMLTDFGIAKAERSGATLTQLGAIIGTVDYMSPEQCTGDRELDGRSDIYSLGAAAYQMLTGRVPFSAPGAREVMLQHLSREPVPLRQLVEDIPEDLAVAVTRCLEKQPERRWADGRSLAAAITPVILAVEPLTARRWYDGFILGRLVPFAYALALLIGFSTTRSRELRSGNAAPAAPTAPADAPRSASYAFGRFLGGYMRGPIEVPARLALRATTPSGRVDPRVVRWFGSLGFATIVFSTIVGVPLVLIAFLMARAWNRKALTELVRRLAMQPWWWHSWYPRRLRHRATTGLWSRAPWPIKLHRGIVDLAGLGIFLIVLPAVVLFTAATYSPSGGTTIEFETFPIGKEFESAVAGELRPADQFSLSWSDLKDPTYTILLGTIVLIIWARRRGLTLMEAARLANGRVFSPRIESLAFWSRPRLLAAFPDRDTASSDAPAANEPRTIDELLRSIEQLDVALRPAYADVAADATRAAREIAATLLGLEREIARLAKDDDPAELERVNRKLAVIDSAASDESESAQMRHLLNGQRDLLLALRSRHVAATERRSRLMESLRTLWLQLALLRSQQANDALGQNGITGQIREICMEVDRQRTATAEVAALSR